MARPKRMHSSPLHFHVPPHIRGWLSKWAKRNDKTVADVCREILNERYGRAHAK